MNHVRLSAGGSDTTAVEGAVAAAATAPAAMQRCTLAALDRCSDFTADLELSHLLPVLDSSLQRITDRIAALVESVGHSLASTSASESAVAGGQAAAPARYDLPPLPQETLQQLLRLPLTLAALQRCIALVDTEVRTRAGRLLAATQAVRDGAQHQGVAVTQRAQDLIAWRLSNSSSEMERALAWQDAMSGVLLPKAFAALAALEGTVDALLTAALCAPSRRALAEVRALVLLTCPA